MHDKRLIFVIKLSLRKQNCSFFIKKKTVLDFKEKPIYKTGIVQILSIIWDALHDIRLMFHLKQLRQIYQSIGAFGTTMKACRIISF